MKRRVIRKAGLVLGGVVMGLLGLAFHPDTGVLWSNEHGPQGGDEVFLLDEIAAKSDSSSKSGSGGTKASSSAPTG